MTPLLSILMPVYNECKTVEQAIFEALEAKLPIPRELVIVDDGSNDGTERILRTNTWPDCVTVHRHPVNRGKGAAVQTALSHARGELASILDADLEYSAQDVAELLPPLLEGKTNAVFGVRGFEGHTSHSFLFVMGNRGVTLATNVLFNVYLRDVMTCHKIITTDVFRSLSLRSRRFEIEPEITARLLQQGERIYEVPVRYSARSHADGKKLTAVDGLRVLATLARCRLTPPAQ